jgi:hypothetical protein
MMAFSQLSTRIKTTLKPTPAKHSLKLTSAHACTIPYVEGEKPPVLCKNCKWIRIDKSYKGFFFKREHTQRELEFSRCAKYTRLDLVSGQKKYEYTSISREYKCHGNGFELRTEDESYEYI